MMGDEMMVPVDPKCVPDGWEPVRFGLPKEGETIIRMTQWGAVVTERVQPKEMFITPRIIIRKKYGPGINLPLGWWLWCNSHGDWIASPACGGTGGICGLQQLPDFIPPQDGEPRQIT